jgi:hypothetical protein
VAKGADGRNLRPPDPAIEHDEVGKKTRAAARRAAEGASKRSNGLGAPRTSATSRWLGSSPVARAFDPHR